MLTMVIYKSYYFHINIEPIDPADFDDILAAEKSQLIYSGDESEPNPREMWDVEK